MRHAARIVLVAGVALALQSGAADLGGVKIVAARDYVAAAAAQLRSDLGPIEGRIELRPRGHYGDLEIKSADPTRVRVQASQSAPMARTVVWIDILAGNRIARRVPVHFEVQWLKSALVARRRLSAGAALVAEMFEQREVEVAGVRGNVVTAFAELDGKRLRRELDSGGVLARAAIEARPPVEAGERIWITANVGGVVVQTTAIAQRDGFRGDRIGARLLNGRRRLRVEVVGENTAKVQEDG